MLRTRTVALLFAAALACTGPRQPSPPTPSVSVGMPYPPLPPGYLHEGGFLVGQGPGITYSLSTVRTPSGLNIWLGRFTHHDSLGKAHWQLRAIAPIPALPSGYSVATMDCSLDGRADSGVFAIGQWVADSLVDVRHAWVALTEVERLDTVPLNRVSCSYDGDRD